MSERFKPPLALGVALLVLLCAAALVVIHSSNNSQGERQRVVRDHLFVFLKRAIVSRGDRRDTSRNNTTTNFQVSYKFVGYQFKKRFPDSWGLRITAMRVSGIISPLSDYVCAVVGRNQSRRPGDK